METKTALMLAGSTFVVGFVCGSVATQKLIVSRLKKVEPLVKNALGSVLQRFAEGDITAEELRELGQQEIDFINIAMGN